jgi:DNA-binding NarL/FixJ family response regulator
MTMPVAAHDGRMPVRVLVVDDHPLFRDTVRRLLMLAGFVVVGEVGGGVAAIAAVGDLRPDLVLLDIQLPDTDGFHVAQELSRFSSPPAVVLVSNRDQSDYGGLVERSHTVGFVAKADLTGARLHQLLHRHRRA